MDDWLYNKSEALDAALRALELMFIGKLPAKLIEIEDALNRLIENSSNIEVLKLLHRLFHTMAGSAGTFGLPEVGLQAKELESRLKPRLSSKV